MPILTFLTWCHRLLWVTNSCYNSTALTPGFYLVIYIRSFERWNRYDSKVFLCGRFVLAVSGELALNTENRQQFQC